ncbi:Mediator of RNA polymerase II transcription subunit 30 [Labeo rohita]|uniref:Mediator of RNA polymerase II transcription subunit 30 n=1 Tax=Labeo rohita TaxID=84645 RepID=A0A498NV35_LABRO|nr:Mediator of RNA polymerase II transcription subunit 30 [Labeo rohita]
MAAATQTVQAREGEAVRLCSCGNKISGKDTHQVCLACLGLKHAQLAIDSPGSCEHCARFTMKSLRRRLARQASLSGLDPLLSPSPTPAATPQVPIPVELPTTAALSWGEQLDACVPLPNVLNTDEEEDALDFEEEGQSDFLLSEEDFEDSPFLPPEHSAQALAAAGPIEDVDGHHPRFSVLICRMCANALQRN